MDFDDCWSTGSCCSTTIPTLARRCSGGYRYILVDEYQDTNKLQAEVVDGDGSGAEKPHGPSATTPNRSTPFAARRSKTSSPSRSDSPKRKSTSWRRNYRSTRQILSLANASIAQNKFQFRKELQAVRGDGPEPGGRRRRRRVRAVPRSSRNESSSCVTKARASAKSQCSIARTTNRSSCRWELSRRLIPYEIRSGVRFFEQGAHQRRDRLSEDRHQLARRAVVETRDEALPESRREDGGGSVGADRDSAGSVASLSEQHRNGGLGIRWAPHARRS